MTADVRDLLDRINQDYGYADLTTGDAERDQGPRERPEPSVWLERR